MNEFERIVHGVLTRNTRRRKAGNQDVNLLDNVIDEKMSEIRTEQDLTDDQVARLRQAVKAQAAKRV